MYYRVRLPDIGEGATQLACFVESESEAAVRELAADHPHFRGWDARMGASARRPSRTGSRSEIKF